MLSEWDLCVLSRSYPPDERVEGVSAYFHHIVKDRQDRADLLSQMVDKLALPSELELLMRRTDGVPFGEDDLDLMGIPWKHQPALLDMSPDERDEAIEQIFEDIINGNDP